MRDFVEVETLLNEDRQRIERYFAEACHVARELGINLRLPRIRPRTHPPGTRGRDRCDWLWTGAYLTYDGIALPCCMVAAPDRFNLGNVAGTDVPSVWNSEAYQEFRQQLDSDEPPEICRSCSIYRGTF